MASDKTNVMRVLEQHKIAYTAHEYPHGKEAVDGVSVAQLLGQDVRQVFKTLVARGKSGGYHVFVIPVAAECGVNMAIHPDDPCWSIFDLPRIITCEENLDRFLSIVDDPHNGITLCTGSLGCSAKNDIPHMAAKYAKMGRIHFAHLRNVLLTGTGFEERGHLSCGGSLDMYAIVKGLVENGFDGYVRPDHGRMIWGETGRAGYGLYDRALGACYLNGLFEAAEKEIGIGK